MTSKNDITGDRLATKETTDAYREGYDRIFGKRTPVDVPSEVKKLLLSTDFLPPERPWFKLTDDEETE